MSVLEAILLATNLLTLNLLVMSIRSTRRWIAAYRDADQAIMRREYKREMEKIRQENGGW